MRKKIFIALMAMVIIFALTSSLYAQETDPGKVLNALADSLNAGDVDAALTLYAPDAVLNIVPPLPGLPGTFTGSKEIRGWLEILVGMNLKIEGVEILQVEGDKVKIKVKTSSDFARGFNMAFMELIEEYTIQDGKIKGCTISITNESAEKLQAAMINQAEKEKVLTAMADSLSAGDLDATMALFTDDAIVKILFGKVLPPESYIGSEQVRFLMEDLVAMNFKIQIEILQVLGDIAITRSKTWHDATIQLGIAPMEMVEIYPIEDGKIEGFVSILTDESLAKLQAALAPK
jgi:ketosteroid isomerase-like protein